METLMLLTYAALCIVVFKVFRIPLNKWTVPTAVLGGIALIGAVIFGMNYNFPYTDVGNQVFRTVPIVSQVRGRVQSVPVKPNQMLRKGDVLFTLDPTPFQAKVDDLQAQIKAASQDALSLNAALSQAQAELSRAVAQRDQSRREYARYREGHAQGAFSDQMVDTRLQTWKADEASVSAAQAKVVQARNALDSVVKGKNTTVASLLAQLQKAQFQLENTVVRAPEDGYVSTVGLRPGTMSTALGMIPLMTFVPVEGAASREYVAAFRQNALQRLHKGEPAELMFPAIPGRRLSRRSGRRAAGDWREPVPGAGQIADHRRAQYPWPGAGGAEGDRSAICRIRSAAGGYPRGGGLLGSSERAVADQEDPDPYEKLGKLYLSRSLSRRARGGRTAPRRGQASLSTRPSIITCCTPCEQGSIRPRTP